MFVAEGAFFPITRGLDLRRGHTMFLQILFGGLSAPFPQDEVVCTGAPLVAVAFNDKFLIRFRFKQISKTVQRRSRINADRILIEIKIDVRELGQWIDRWR